MAFSNPAPILEAVRTSPNILSLFSSIRLVGPSLSPGYVPSSRHSSMSTSGRAISWVRSDRDVENVAEVAVATDISNQSNTIKIDETYGTALQLA